MSLTTGTRIGPYEIVAPLGAGGMGEVYRARDTRLHREVAIKSLPDLFSMDPERVSRFEREAHMLAALTHPHIGAIYGLEEFDGRRHLVLELVPGETLAKRVENGALPIPEALDVARQVADALQAAHEKGIVHRDLKPGNVMLTPDGDVKVLDFGLAKALAPDANGAALSSGSLDQSPTITSPAMTAMGVIIGTAAYMAPEQAKGRIADKRSDIWAFGCLLFEMITGARAFAGDDVSDTLAAVLRGEPEWTKLPPNTPAFLDRLLRRCLQKDRKHRLPDLSIARYEIEEFQAGRLAPSAPSAVRSTSTRRTAAITLASTVLGIVATAALFRFALWPEPTPRHIARFEVKPPANTTAFLMPIGAGVDITVAPDGSKMVYTISADPGMSRALRRMGEIESTVLPGTLGATSPSFSPDGTRLAFQVDAHLMVLTIGATAPIKVCPLPTAVVGTRWLDERTILFAQRAIFKVAAAGGAPEKVFAPDAESKQHYTFPEVTPDRKALLFTVNEGAQRYIAVRELDTGEQKLVVQNASYPRYVSPGYLLFVQGGRLAAARWNASSRKIEADVVPVEQEVAQKLSGAATFDVAADGTFVGMAGASLPYRSRFIWKSATGQVLGALSTEDMDYPRYPRLSRDGRLLAATVGFGSRGHIWVYDLAGTRQPLKLTMTHHNILPVWMPDGKHVIFRRINAGVSYGGPSEPEGLMMMPADGSSLAAKSLVPTLTGTSPVSDVSFDGEWLLSWRDYEAAHLEVFALRAVCR